MWWLWILGGLCILALAFCAWLLLDIADLAYKEHGEND